MKKSNTALLIFFGLPLFSTPAWAWFAEGHQIVAIIAADDLTPAARSHVARILGVHADTASVQKAMASASIRPDTDLRDQDPSTAQWHFINICLQDKEADLRARCPQGNCVSAKIEEYAQRLRDQNYDQWGAAGDLAFLIHFVADIHQPLHTATNADLGGTCQQVKVEPAEPNLHFVWDDAVVLALEKQLGTHDPSATARRLESLYPAGSNLTWKRGESERIAWQSHQLASTEVYGALGIPEKPCALHSCDAATKRPVALNAAYIRRASQIAGRQLARAGHRLAGLLNGTWSSSEVPHAHQ